MNRRIAQTGALLVILLLTGCAPRLTRVLEGQPGRFRQASGPDNGITLVRDGETFTPRRGRRLRTGDILRTDGRTVAVVRHKGGHLSFVMEDTEIALGSIEIFFGRVINRVQDRLRKYIYGVHDTSGNSANATGTEYEVVVVKGSGEMGVTVLDGTVRVRSEGGDRPILLAAGERIVAGGVAQAGTERVDPDTLRALTEQFNEVSRTAYPAKGKRVVPTLLGMTPVEARRYLSSLPEFSLGTVGRTIDAPDTTPPDTIVGQVPAAGESLQKTKPIDATIYVEPAVVPSTGSLNREEAEAQVVAAGLRVRVDTVLTCEAKPGEVLRQRPVGGQEVLPDSTVTLFIEGDGVRVPNLSTVGPEAVEGTLARGRLAQGEVSTRYVVGIDTGRVSSQSPGPGACVEAGSRVTHTVEQPGVAVPNLSGLDASDAAANVLSRAGLALGKVTEADCAEFDGPAGHVATQEPARTDVVGRGSAVDVSVFADRVEVPRLVGSSAGAAARLVQVAGLSYREDTRLQAGLARAEVVSQSPAAGTRECPGEAVTATVGQPAVDVPNFVGLSYGAAVERAAALALAVTFDSSASCEEEDTICGQTPRAGLAIAGTVVELRYRASLR
ncbi:MAG: beta-lactam-binding protein with PASTA domain [Myxococcota bacterium]